MSSGVYASRVAWEALKPWERYLARVHAASMRYPDAVFCLDAAAAFRSLPIFGEPEEVHVIAPAHATARASAGVRVHLTAEPRSIEEIDGILVTDVADTVVDLARGRHNAVGLAVANAALRANPQLTSASLRAVNEGRASSRWRRHARWPLERAIPTPESPLESVSLAAVEWLGIPPPELQRRFCGPDHTDRVDFWWHATRTAIDVGATAGCVRSGSPRPLTGRGATSSTPPGSRPRSWPRECIPAIHRTPASCMACVRR